jgi:hypothetical protein
MHDDHDLDSSVFYISTDTVQQRNRTLLQINLQPFVFSNHVTEFAADGLVGHS